MRDNIHAIAMNIATYIVYSAPYPSFKKRYDSGIFINIKLPVNSWYNFTCPVACIRVINGKFIESINATMMTSLANNDVYSGTLTSHTSRITSMKAIIGMEMKATRKKENFDDLNTNSKVELVSPCA